MRVTVPSVEARHPHHAVGDGDVERTAADPDRLADTWPDARSIRRDGAVGGVGDPYERARRWRATRARGRPGWASSGRPIRWTRRRHRRRPPTPRRPRRPGCPAGAPRGSGPPAASPPRIRVSVPALALVTQTTPSSETVMPSGPRPDRIVAATSGARPGGAVAAAPRRRRRRGRRRRRRPRCAGPRRAPPRAAGPGRRAGPGRAPVSRSRRRSLPRVVGHVLRHRLDLSAESRPANDGIEPPPAVTIASTAAASGLRSSRLGPTAPDAFAAAQRVAARRSRGGEARSSAAPRRRRRAAAARRGGAGAAPAPPSRRRSAAAPRRARRRRARRPATSAARGRDRSRASTSGRREAVLGDEPQPARQPRRDEHA